jgi:hypothetical protein
MLTSRIQVGCQEYGCSFYVAAALRRCGLPGPRPRKEMAAQIKACQPVWPLVRITPRAAKIGYATETEKRT